MYINAIYGVDSLTSDDTLALPCYVPYLSFTLCISQINDSKYMHVHELFVLGGKHKIQVIISIQVSQEEWSIFWEVIVSVILNKKSVYSME